MGDEDHYPHESSSVFNDLRLQGSFCDATIKVKDVSFKVHRVILATYSPYFLNVFRCSSPQDKVFDTTGLSPDMMQLIIEFAYTGSVSVTEENVRELLLAANHLQVADIVQTCSDFLVEHLCPRSCIGLFQFPKICFSSSLQHKAYRYIIDHFEEVALCEEFLQLSAHELTAMLDGDDLNVNKESIAYEAVLRWIANGPEERKAHITELLSKVRLGLMSVNYLMSTVIQNELVINSLECMEMVMKTAETMSSIMTTSRTSGSHLSILASRPRLPYAVMLAIGGWSGGDPTNSIEAYDIRADYWINVTIAQERPRAYHGAAFLNGSVYCVGGSNRAEQLNIVRRLDLRTHVWHEVAPMFYCRCYVSVTVLDGYIYAMGGYDGYTRLCTAERYRPETNQWSLIAPMQEHRSDASSTTLHDMVYICGGFNGNECLQTCECYRPRTDQWTTISPMSCPRSGIGIIAYADRVYAVGGFDGSRRLSTAESYNPCTNTWLRVKSMITPRSNFGIAMLDNQLFVVGGFNGFTTSCNVEYYDVATDAWAAARNMEIFRSALSCCVACPLPNMDEYVVSRDVLLPLYLDDVCMESGDSD
ncbi:klhl10 [Pungitius sinensis]